MQSTSNSELRLLQRLRANSFSQLIVLGELTSGRAVVVYGIAKKDVSQKNTQFTLNGNNVYVETKEASANLTKKHQVVHSLTISKDERIFIFGNNYHCDIIARAMTQGEDFAEVTQWLSSHSIVIGPEPVVSGLVRVKNEKFSFETSITTNNGGQIKNHYSNSPTLSIGLGLGVVLLTYPNSPRYSLFTTNINGGIYDTGERLWNLIGESSRTALFAQKIFPDERKSKIETWS